MGDKPPIIDAEFEVVDGPYRVGDEHRERRGWYLTDLVGKHGEPLWYKPPSKAWRHFRKWIVLYAIGAAFVCGVVQIAWMVLTQR